MAFIPLETKISLINKYIQLNFMKPKGKDLYMDIPENEIFESILADLNKLNDKKDQPKFSIDSVITILRNIQQSQTTTRRQIKSLMGSTRTVVESLENPDLDLESVIKELSTYK